MKTAIYLFFGLLVVLFRIEGLKQQNSDFQSHFSTSKNDPNLSKKNFSLENINLGAQLL